jgi:hydroxymethylbilane synthase
MKLRVGTRPSELALKQVKEIARAVPAVEFEIVPIETKGDIDKTTPLSSVEASDFFTQQIEEALLDGSIDAAVHSAKDLEENVPAELVIAALTRSVSPYECLVSRNGRTLKELPEDAVVGTSSINRKEAILKFRNDLVVKDIRGDIKERLRQLDEGHYDAIVVAHAALIRLGYEDRITEIILPSMIEPHPLQGRLAVQVRRDRPAIAEIFRSIDAR